MPKMDCDDLGGTDPDDTDKDEATVTLKDFYFPNGTYQTNRSLKYDYDFGDGWIHDIVFLGTAPSDFRNAMHVPAFLPVFCISGEGHPCAEDCGGGAGWEDVKDAFRKPKSSRGSDLREWYNNECANGDAKGLDPYKWDVFDVNAALHEEFGEEE
jgi:Plasmid pRiA4b ORF-3-like protein